MCKPSNRLPDSDALIIADDHLPREIRSMSALLRAGSRRLVIISLEAFSKIAGDAVRLRRIEQPDDPLCAKIFRADFMTRGFALHDVIPFAATAIDPRVFRQRQLRRGAGLEKLNKTHGFEIVLTAVTDADSSTGHPICLHKPMDGGGIVVLDLDPIDAPPSNRNESNPAAFILQNTLGFDQVSLGHYSVPVRDERRLRDLLELLADRYPAMRLTGSTARDTVAEIGGSTRTFGLVEDTRPAVLIRTLLTGEDVSGFYGTWYYLRHLIRPEPDASPYALQLLRSFRLIWKPVGAPLRHADAASVLDESSTDRDLPIDPSELAAVIDVTECPTNDTRVIYDRNASTAARHTEIQKTLGNSLGGDGFVYWTGPVGEEVSQFDDHGWRLETPASQVLVAPKAFRDPLHRAAAQAGARLIRIEVPQSNAAFAADSVFRTDRVATMLERVIGLRYGYLAVNRRCDAISIPGYGTLKPGEAILAPENGKSRQASKRVG